MKKTLLLSTLLCLLLPLLVAHSQSSATRPGRKHSLSERLQPERLRAVHEACARFTAARRDVKLRTGLNDYRAILHAHAEDAKHTGGTRPELLLAARRTGVHIVMLTDHVRPPRDFINDSWRGLREGVLFIPGAEAEGFLAYPMNSIKGKTWKGRDEYAALVRSGGGDIFLSHVEERPDWPTNPLTGMEVYNLHTDFKDDQFEFVKWLSATVSDPDKLAAFQKTLAQYPQEAFGVSQDYLTEIIAKWDRDSQQHRVTGVAANDCHHNQVVTVKVADARTLEMWLTGDDEPSFKVTAKQHPRLTELTSGKQPGEVIAVIDFDPYERSLRYVTTHILAKELNENAVRGALKQAHAYVAHDWLCDPTDFAFVAVTGKRARQVGVMGDEIKMTSGLRLRVAAPISGTIRLFQNGTMVKEASADQLEWPVTAPGAYRVELWLEVDGELRPWIYANPIRVLS